MVILQNFISKLTHWWKAKTIYSIHSPFIYEYIRFVFDENRNYYAFIALSSKTSYKPEKNLDKNRKQNSRLPRVEKQKLHLIYRHIIHSQSKCVGFKNIDPKVMAYLCAMADVQSLINLDSDSRNSYVLSRKLKYGSRTIDYLHSLNAHFTYTKDSKIDLIVFQKKPELELKHVENALKNSSDTASCLILKPYSLNAKEQKAVERKFPLILRSHQIQVMWKKRDVAPQKIDFTTNSITKPWQYIHAI